MVFLGKVKIIPLLLWSVSTFHTANSGDDYSRKNVTSTSYRSGRCFFPLVVLKVKGDTCASQIDGYAGNCYSWKDCKHSRGTFGGYCAYGVGICCVFRQSSDTTIRHNNTYFQSRNYPSGFKPSGLESSTADILKPSDEICQARLDFLRTDLQGPDSNGVCQTDRIVFFGIPAAAGSVPLNLCGNLSGQPIFLEFGSSKKISMSIITDGNLSDALRKWNIRVRYIECNSPLAAPSGCLQYLTGVSGHVSILGYPQSPHLADLSYTVCVRPEQGARGIRWSRCTGQPEDVSFWFTGPPISSGINAQKGCGGGDFVVILNTLDSSYTNDRHCGNSLTSESANGAITSYDKPFILRIKTDAEEGEAEKGNTGFCLDWTQVF